MADNNPQTGEDDLLVPEVLPQEQALENLKRFLLPGDVINLSGRSPWWNLAFKCAYRGIRSNQRRIFGNQSNWHDTHCMLYLDPEHTLSVEPPRARWLKPEDYCLDRLSVWRFTKWPTPLNDEEKAVMMDCAERHLINTTYDVGQLLDILVNTILRYPHVLRYRLFDFGKKYKVCSVGVRVLFEALRKYKLEHGKPSYSRLFARVNPLAPWPGGIFPQSRIRGKYGVDVEATSPAHFANSHYFEGEFRLVAVMDSGKILWQG